MPRVAKGYIEQLPSGSFRVSVYAGTDPLTRRAIRLKATAKTEQQAHIELGRLLKEASEGRTPESNATVAKLLDEYAAIAEWDVSTRQTNEGFIRRTIKPALGHLEVRKVRGPSSTSCTRGSSAAATCPVPAGRSPSIATSRPWFSTRATVGQLGSR
jgi:integrase